MTNAPRLLVPTIMLSAFALQAGELRVCIEDRADLGVPARAGLVRELKALLPDVQLKMGSHNCNAADGADILLSVLDSRPDIPSDALGLAFSTRGGVILPRLEVFVEPIRRLTGAGDWQTVGRALARVAAHELIHYTRQASDHDAHGLMRDRLTPSDLVSEEIRPALMASLRRD